MSFSRWLRNWMVGSEVRQARTRRYRPRIEALEDRCVPTTFTVINTLDSGAGSLRQAILDANAAAGLDTIAFGVGVAGGAQTIAPAAELPTITDSVNIDGTTQPGFAGSPLIELDGSAGLVNGLVITAGGSTVRGLVINRFSASGIVLQTSGGNVIQGNFIGTDPTGNVALANSYDAGASYERGGVLIFDGSHANRIGTDGDGLNDLAERNVISGNAHAGVFLSRSDDNVIAGNYIGTDVSGTANLGNLFAGISILEGNRNRIGTDGDGIADVAERNVISGNGRDVDPWDGVGIGIAGFTEGFSAADNVVAGNYIGTDATGTQAIANLAGVRIVGSAQRNLIGTRADGTANTATRNVISGNTREGVGIQDALALSDLSPGADFNVIAGNYLGTTADGIGDLGNGWSGVQIGGYTGFVYGTSTRSSGASFNRIGGSTPADRNIIAGNGDDPIANPNHGVSIDGLGADQNVVIGNWIGQNVNAQALSNEGAGVAVTGQAMGNQVGGSGGQANVIAFNLGAGVLFRERGENFYPAPGGIYDEFIADGPTLDNHIPGNTIHSNAADILVATGSADDTVTAVALVPGVTSVVVNGNLIVDVSNSGGVTLDGLNGSDTYAITFGGLSGPVTVADSGTTGTNALTAQGTAGPDAFLLAGNQVQNGTEAVTVASPMASISVAGGGGVDTTTVNGFTAPTTNLTVDGTGGTNAVTIVGSPPAGVQITLVSVVPPAVAPITGPTVGVRGQTLSYAASFTDSTSAGPHAALWTWDDGTTSEGVVSSGTVYGSHIFTTAGLHSFTLTLTNPYGLTAIVQGFVQVLAVALQANPFDPTRTDLYIGGTNGDDKIVVRRRGCDDDHEHDERPIEVLINNVSLGTFQPTGRIVVFAQGGNDNVWVRHGIRLESWLYGGDGNDTLRAGAGVNVLMGGNGHDELFSGGGRDLLIGGLGSDVLHAGSGQDILIGSSTRFDMDEAALHSIVAEWARKDMAYDLRVRHLTGTPGGVNEGNYLTAATVSDDGEKDKLKGGSGLDLFVPGLGDKLDGCGKKDTVIAL